MRRSRLTVGVAGAAVVLGTASLTALSSSPAVSAPTAKATNQVRSALGMGLGRTIATGAGPAASTQRRAAGRAVGSAIDLSNDRVTVRDTLGRILIDATPAAGADPARFRKQAEALGMVVDNQDPSTGTIEGYAPLGAIQALAALKTAGTVSQSLKPYVFAGSTTSQGVPFQRINKVLAKGINGQGITIGALSDSYNTATKDFDGSPLTIHEAQDIASGDLPGPGNPDGDVQPVEVIQDSPPDEGHDEGRAMLQILHDIAPKAKLCFATAGGGVLNFAANIRALADKSGPCGADVIVDDIAYFEEPMFSDSPITDAIDDVTADGVSYFSSEGNEGGEQAWASKVHLLHKAAAKRAIKRSKLRFGAVDPSLYDGGLQDADPGAGSDIAQTITTPRDGGLLDLQWDDPLDRDGAVYGPDLFTASGVLTTPTDSLSYQWTANDEGKVVDIRADGVPSGSTDLVLNVTDPDGNSSGDIDTSTSPEFLVAVTKPGKYTITVTGYDGATGPFTVKVREIQGLSKTTTDFNLLVFTMKGRFVGAAADINPLSGRPQEFTGLGGRRHFQLVISRSAIGAHKATHLRLHAFDDLYLTEYGDPLAPSTTGHAYGRSTNGVAAIDPFKPYLPEDFTSTGGRLPVKFDSDGNKLAKVEIRQTPKFAATDGGNTTFFVSDSSRDADSFPNFFGTSAAAPHAAGIAALVLQERGGPGTVTPKAMTSLLQRSTFAHDLDPMKASGTAHGLTVSAVGAQGYERGAVPGEMADPSFFRISYQGRSPLRSITFLGETASPTARGHKGHSDGLVFDPRRFRAAGPTFQTMGFPFRLGAVRGGLAANDIRAAFTVKARGVSAEGRYRHLTLRFSHRLHKGQALRFGVDRDEALSAFGDSSEGNGADQLGGAVLIPQRVTLRAGMRFRAVRSDGTTFVGVVRNRLGHGWTPVDGFGVIDAQRAVLGK